jgi:hypothetical protein
MTLRSYLVLALIAGVVGAYIGWTASRDVPSGRAVLSASSVPSAAVPARRSCKAERADLVGVQVQLAFCMAARTRDSEAKSSGIAQVAQPDPAESELIKPRPPSTEEIETYRHFVESESGAVLVRRSDGTIGVFDPDEWPMDGDGVITARKLPDGRIGWYAGPDAGPRSDPAAFRPWEPEIPTITWGRELDGTITINGKPASASVQFMFGGKLRGPAKPQE